MSGAPQFEQDVAVSGLSVPHLVQYTISEISYYSLTNRMLIKFLVLEKTLIRLSFLHKNYKCQLH
jgi:hypothetical protein